METFEGIVNDTSTEEGTVINVFEGVVDNPSMEEGIVENVFEGVVDNPSMEEGTITNIFEGQVNSNGEKCGNVDRIFKNSIELNQNIGSVKGKNGIEEKKFGQEQVSTFKINRYPFDNIRNRNEQKTTIFHKGEIK